LKSALIIFQIFVGVIGFIALTLAFFLLMVSTTSNIRENVWEYGCLRAIGLNTNQGMRLVLYEQYSVIIASLTLGGLVGIILSCIVTA
jgi:ABC-type antimicrobial peptide transport system permease subunit